MLLNLHVKNLAIIDEAEVDFTPHLNVLTGETGAGKSIVIGSIGTTLGGKVSKDLIRTGAEFALTEMTFLVEEEKKREELAELGISLEEDGTLLISRKITQTRTINRVNGETVTASVIKQIADLLLDIHGQNEQQSLLHKAKHLEILDRYAGEELAGEAEKFENLYRRFKEIEQELSGEEMPEEERLREISFLQYELQEIENASLVSGEEEELENQFKILSNASKIAEGLSEIYQETSQAQDSVSERIAAASRTLQQIVTYDERLGDYADQLSDLDSLVTDFNRSISEYMDGFETNPEKLNEVEKRLDLVRSLKAKYGATTEDVLLYAENVRKKLARYEDYESHREELKKEMEEVRKQLDGLSASLTKIRTKCAEILEKEIMQALSDLNFLQASFMIRITAKEEYTAKGVDDVEFLISTNPGEELRPLKNIASGGELSRIMLAIKTVFVAHDDIPTMIFDEIDVGISGRTAQMVAEKLAVLGKEHQVICISHLAQIAAMADTQYLIEKENEGGHTSSMIRQLSEEESIQELARILGGAEITETVLENAREMKKLAYEKKKGNQNFESHNRNN